MVDEEGRYDDGDEEEDELEEEEDDIVIEEATPVEESRPGLRERFSNIGRRAGIVGRGVGAHLRNRALPYGLAAVLAVGGIGGYKGYKHYDNLQHNLAQAQTEVSKLDSMSVLLNDGLNEEKSRTSELSEKLNQYEEPLRRQELLKKLEQVHQEILKGDMSNYASKVQKEGLEQDSLYNVAMDRLSDREHLLNDLGIDDGDSHFVSGAFADSVINALKPELTYVGQAGIDSLKAEKQTLEARVDSLEAEFAKRRPAKGVSADEARTYNFNTTDVNNDGTLDRYEYTVRPGDTFSRIKEEGFEKVVGRKYLGYSDFTIDGNEVATPGRIKPGQIIAYEAPSAAEKPKLAAQQPKLKAERKGLREFVQMYGHNLDLNRNGSTGDDDIAFFNGRFGNKYDLDINNDGIVDGKDFDQIIRDFNDDRYTIESKSAPADTLKSRVGEPTVTAVTPIITTEASGLENISLGIGVKNTGLRGNVDYKNLGVELGARIKQEVPTQPLYFLGRGSLPLGDYSRLGTKVGIVVENTDTHPRDLGDKKTNPVLVGYIRVGPSDGAGVEFELGRVFDGKDSYNLIGAGLTYDLGGSNPQSKGLSSTQMREVEEATRPDSLDALTGKTSDTNEPIIHPITGEVLPSIAGMYDMNGDGRITSNDAELLATIFPNHPRYDIVHYGEIGGQKLNKYDFWEGLLRDNLDVYRDGTSIEDRIFVEGFDDYRTNVRTNLSISERGG